MSFLDNEIEDYFICHYRTFMQWLMEAESDSKKLNTELNSWNTIAEREE